MAYVALSRVRRLMDLHLWGWEPAAIKADPKVQRVYQRLSTRSLTMDVLRQLPSYEKPNLLPMELIYKTSYVKWRSGL